MMEYHIVQLEELVTNVIEQLSPESRWRVFNAILKEYGVQEELPYIFEKTGKPSRWAEAYLENLKEVLAFARASLEHLEVGEGIYDGFRVVEVTRDEV